MPKFKPQTKLAVEGEQDLNKIEAAITAAEKRQNIPPVPYESRCDVCNSPYRRFIDAMLSRGGSSYQSIADRIPGPEIKGGGNKKLDRRSVANHAKKHLGYVDDAIRALLEAEAEQEGQDYEQNVRGAITHRGVLESLVRKSFNDVMTGKVDVEPKDLLQAITALRTMDEQTNSAQVDYLRAQTSAFIQAIKEEVDDQALWGRIANRAKNLMAREGYQDPVKVPNVEAAELPPTNE